MACDINNREGRSPSPTEPRLGRTFRGSATGRRRQQILPPTAPFLRGRVDIGYVRQPISDRGLRLVPLFAERRLAALPSDHRLARRTSVSTADLAGERHLRYLDRAPVPDAPGPQLRIRSVEEKLEHVAAAVQLKAAREQNKSAGRYEAYRCRAKDAGQELQPPSHR